MSSQTHLDLSDDQRRDLGRRADRVESLYADLEQDPGPTPPALLAVIASQADLLALLSRILLS